uniref:Uncharacterized protein n=1 Tax=Spongospora subterranea TaxID=70186 RepID=A0A0H5RDU3_9EUKA|eukprot:CRZ11931.1 hypothetical protein [Spongospora subterranea]
MAQRHQKHDQECLPEASFRIQSLDPSGHPDPEALSPYMKMCCSMSNISDQERLKRPSPTLLNQKLVVMMTMMLIIVSLLILMTIMCPIIVPKMSLPLLTMNDVEKILRKRARRFVGDAFEFRWKGYQMDIQGENCGYKGHSR